MHSVVEIFYSNRIWFQILVNTWYGVVPVLSSRAILSNTRYCSRVSLKRAFCFFSQQDWLRAMRVVNERCLCFVFFLCGLFGERSCWSRLIFSWGWCWSCLCFWLMLRVFFCLMFLIDVAGVFDWYCWCFCVLLLLLASCHIPVRRLCSSKYFPVAVYAFNGRLLCRRKVHLLNTNQCDRCKLFLKRALVHHPHQLIPININSTHGSIGVFFPGKGRGLEHSTVIRGGVLGGMWHRRSTCPITP